jgi:hypothetical protein
MPQGQACQSHLSRPCGRAQRQPSDLAVLERGAGAGRHHSTVREKPPRERSARVSRNRRALARGSAAVSAGAAAW